jgi:hypothetical protein
VNKEVKGLWIEALRSGEYQQGQNYLSNNGKYCCLGVLCEVAIKQGVELKRYSGYVVRYGQREKIGILPPEVVDWADIDDLGTLPNSSEFYSLTAANDSGIPFRQIAELIEEYL